jgi:hypothetical protein
MTALDLAVREFLACDRIAVAGVSRDGKQPANAITVIPGACPMMYLAPVDVAHRCVRTVLGWFGRLPKVEHTAADPTRKPRT